MEMRKPLEVWHAVMSGVILIMSVGGVIINQSNKIQSQQIRIEYLESEQRDNTLQFKEIGTNFKQIDGKLTDILVILQNKEDRKDK